MWTLLHATLGSLENHFPGKYVEVCVWSPMQFILPRTWQPFTALSGWQCLLKDRLPWAEFPVGLGSLPDPVPYRIMAAGWGKGHQLFWSREKQYFLVCFVVVCVCLIWVLLLFVWGLCGFFFVWLVLVCFCLVWGVCFCGLFGFCLCFALVGF